MKIVADRNIPFVEACVGYLGSVELVNGREVTRDVVKDAQALLVRSVTQVNESLLQGSDVQFVGTATIGFEHIDRDYLARHGIGFSSAPGSNANSVAEYVVACLLEMAHRKDLCLADSSISIIGVGNVGSRVAAKCQGLGMRVVRNDPPLAKQTGDAQYRPIDEVFECDFVTMHTPLTREGEHKTFHLADQAFFDALKQGTIFMNSGRGSVMDTQALKQAMASGRLGGVCLDVWENEPAIDCDLLRQVDLASPHIAGYSFDGKVAGMTMIYEAMCQHLNLPVSHTASDFMPEPEIPVLHLDNQGTLQASVYTAVQKIYDLLKDDADIRAMADVAESEQGQFFDALRKNYPVRREFQNTTIQLKTPDTALSSVLKAIGFACKDV